MTRLQVAASGVYYAECADGEIRHRQDKRKIQREKLLAWLKNNPGWHLIRTAAKECGIPVNAVGSLSFEKGYFQREVRDNNSTSAYMIRSAKALEVEPWQA